MDGDLVEAVGILMVASVHVVWSHMIDKSRLKSLLFNWATDERGTFRHPCYSYALNIQCKIVSPACLSFHSWEYEWCRPELNRHGLYQFYWRFVSQIVVAIDQTSNLATPVICYTSRKREVNPFVTMSTCGICNWRAARPRPRPCALYGGRRISIFCRALNTVSKCASSSLLRHIS